MWVCVNAWLLRSKWLMQFCFLWLQALETDIRCQSRRREREILGLSEKEIQRDGGRDRHILSSHRRYSTINCYLELHTHIQTCSFACSVTNKRVFIAGRTLLQQCHLSTANKNSTPVTVRLHSSGILNHRITLISNAWPEITIYLEYWIRTSKNWNTDWDCH